MPGVEPRLEPKWIPRDIPWDIPWDGVEYPMGHHGMQGSYGNPEGPYLAWGGGGLLP